MIEFDPLKAPKDLRFFKFKERFCSYADIRIRETHS